MLKPIPPYPKLRLAARLRVSLPSTSGSDLPPDVLTFSAIIYNKGKRSKDSEVAEVTVELKDLASGDEVRWTWGG